MMFNELVLSSAIAWGGANPAQVVYDNPEREAVRAVSKALYRELDLDKTVKRIEKRYLPDEVKEYGGYAAIGYRIFVERRISYEWTF